MEWAGAKLRHWQRIQWNSAASENISVEAGSWRNLIRGKTLHCQQASRTSPAPGLGPHHTHPAPRAQWACGLLGQGSSDPPAQPQAGWHLLAAALMLPEGIFWGFYMANLPVYDPMERDAMRGETRSRVLGSLVLVLDLTSYMIKSNSWASSFTTSFTFDMIDMLE